MKKILTNLILLSFFFQMAAFAADDVLNDASSLSREFDNQKIISPQAYENLLKKLKPQKKKKKSKERELMPSSVIDEETAAKPNIFTEKYSATLGVPAVLIYDSGYIPIGYYKICASKGAEGKYYLDFYQGPQKVASLPAFASNKDYGEETINYVRILPYSDNILKIIYGSIDYNLETLVRFYTPN